MTTPPEIHFSTRQPGREACGKRDKAQSPGTATKRTVTVDAVIRFRAHPRRGLRIGGAIASAA